MKKPKIKVGNTEADSVFFLKILMYSLVSLIWVKHNGYLIFPLGLLIGVIFTRFDHFVIDKKIEYAILILGTFVSAAAGGLWIII